MQKERQKGRYIDIYRKIGKQVDVKIDRYRYIVSEKHEKRHKQMNRYIDSQSDSRRNMKNTGIQIDKL